MKTSLLSFFLVTVLVVGNVWAEERAVITGDQLQLQELGQVAVFIGHVRMTHGKTVMTANRMMQEKATGLIQAEGEVHLLSYLEPSGQGGAGSAKGQEQEEVVNAYGDFGRYDQGLKHGRLWGQAWLTQEQPGKPDTRMKMAAKTIELWRPERQLHGQEAVRIETQDQGHDTWATADQAIYYQEDRRVVLTGGPPVVFQETSDGSHLGRADLVTLWPDTRKVLFVGHMRGTFQSRPKEPV
ncbi:MAG: hypothetical protein HYZ73_00135 [Elusimicrobia bacterium]|nr:hypothetical protein [Elusimicrobiota bacterium]